MVAVGQRVCDGVTVAVGLGVREGVLVSVGELVWVGDEVTVGEGISPITVKYPDTFHSVPTNICTS